MTNVKITYTKEDGSVIKEDIIRVHFLNKHCKDCEFFDRCNCLLFNKTVTMDRESYGINILRCDECLEAFKGSNHENN